MLFTTKQKKEDVLMQNQELDCKFAYHKSNPIRDYTGAINTIDVSNIDKEWEQTLIKNNMWWYYKNNTPPISNFDLRLFELRKKLLQFAGHNVCLPVTEPDLDNILNRGQLWYGDIAKVIKGKPSRCHENASLYFLKNNHNCNPGVLICTGYAISDDGMWRQHSWCICKKANKTQIIETTVKRVAYFGFVLQPEEAVIFAKNNTI